MHNPITASDIVRRWKQARERNNLHAWRALSYLLSALAAQSQADNLPLPARVLARLSDRAMRNARALQPKPDNVIELHAPHINRWLPPPSQPDRRQMTTEEQASATRIAIIQAIDAEWEKHAQPITVSVPTGGGSFRTVNGGHTISRIGFNLAVHAIVQQVTGEPIL